MMPKPHHKTQKPLWNALVLGLLFIALAPSAFAATASCKPGIPCDAALRVNDPAKTDDGPNKSGAPNAAKNESASCDADFMNQIYGKAFLEAEREMASANAIIAKPDSILEYTCLDQAVATNAHTTAGHFAESKDWKDKDISTGDSDTKLNVDLGDKYMDNRLQSAVLSSMNKYVSSNFSHDYLGGRAKGDDNSLSKTVAGAKKICDSMYNVYHIAKCSDFGLEAPYMTFEKLITLDPRTRPMTCGKKPEITQKIIDIANNKGFKYTAFDKVTPYTSTFQNDGKTCAPPVPTGTNARTTERSLDLAGNPVKDEDYKSADKTCPTPGCYLDTKGNSDPADDTCEQNTP